MPRPLTAHVDLAALRHNHARVRQLARGARILSVIKANAYGHHARLCAPALDTDGFALLTLEEAQTVRALGLDVPILLLEGFFSPADLPHVKALAATPVIHDAEQVRMLECAPALAPAQVFLKIDSGMHRLGFAPTDALNALVRLQAITTIQSVTLMTHYASADAPEGTAEAASVMEALRARQPAISALPTSYANSAALLAAQAFPDSAPPALGDWVRPGIMLYGCSPIETASAASLGLQPVMRLASELISVRTVPAGEGIGYGAAFRADHAMRIGVVACGYADGYPRHAGTGTPIVVDGNRTRVLGRVSMDMLCVDLDSVPGAAVGTPVELFGPALSADEVARAAGTVSYEILTGIAARVPIQCG